MRNVTEFYFKKIKVKSYAKFLGKLILSSFFSFFFFSIVDFFRGIGGVSAESRRETGQVNESETNSHSDNMGVGVGGKLGLDRTGSFSK